MLASGVKAIELVVETSTLLVISWSCVYSHKYN